MRISDWSSDVCSSDLDQWRWPARIDDELSLSLRCAFTLQEAQHIVDLDAVRHGVAVEPDLALPAWMIADTRAWVVVPVLHSSVERRGGKECVSACRSRLSPYNKKKKKPQTTNR